MSASTKRRLRPVKQAVQRLLRLVGREIQYDFDSSRFRLRRYRDLGRNQWTAARAILGDAPTRIFDVGANTGQTALELARRFPRASIHSFEPTPAVAAELRQTVAHLPRVQVHEIALGLEDGTASFHLNRMAQTNSLLASAPGHAAFNSSAAMQETVEIIDVPVMTIASFCVKHGIERIDILKTDAQGADLSVIEGAGTLLPHIPLVYAEVSFVPLYDGQPTFGAFHDRMNALGYRLVDLYETGFRSHFYQLSCNALFMREDGPRP